MVTRFFASVLVSVLALVSVPQSAQAAWFSDDRPTDIDHTRCLGEVLTAPTSTPHIFEFAVRLYNVGNDDAFIWKRAFYVIDAASGGACFTTLQLTGWQHLYAADTDNFLVLVAGLNYRDVYGRVEITGSWLPSDVDGLVVSTLQNAIVSSVPTPGTASVIALAGIVASRRRR